MASVELTPLVSRALDPLLRYHDHEVVGLEHVPVVRPALLVLHHSLATYDGLLLAARIFHRTGRAPTALAHDRFFDVAAVGGFVQRLGVHRASPGNGRTLLSEGHLVAVAPGGMWEALRPSSERYRVRWTNRRGFVRLALEAQVPMVLAACPRADDLFDVQDHPLTHWVYDTFRWPLPLVRGRRGLPVPRRLKLVHHVAPPIHPPPLEGPIEAQIDTLHARATEVMNDLLSRRGEAS